MLYTYSDKRTERPKNKTNLSDRAVKMINEEASHEYVTL